MKKKLPDRKKCNSYLLQIVNPQSAIKCTRCKKAMTLAKRINQGASSSIGWLYQWKQSFEYKYKCQKCNLWQSHYSSKKFAESLFRK